MFDDKFGGSELLKSVRGLLFFGTPFRGAEGMRQKEMVKAAAREHSTEDMEPETLYILGPGNDQLIEMVDRFQGKIWPEMPRTRIACFYELQRSEMGKFEGKQNRRVRPS